MTISGFILHAQRSNNVCDSIIGFACCSSAQDGIPGNIEDMVCPQSSSANCHSKLLMYAAGIAVGGAVIGYFIGQKLAKNKARCNYSVKLNTDKVVDTVDIEEIGEKKAYCRCWKSKKFPLCDGSHNAHNKETGDNAGPIVIKGKSEPAQ